jgi:formate dehydrogenase beta subunit
MTPRLGRRRFLGVAGTASAGSLLAGHADAATATTARKNGRAVLVDTTRCIGCRACEAACSEVNGLLEPERPGDPAVFDAERDMTTTRFTVVQKGNQAAADGAERFAKRQCLHCVDPACASACPVRALEKRDDGPVVYHAERCMGCRYCMVACPFGVPRYQYEAAVPYVRKCTFCAPRLAEGKPPACSSVCPSGALKFGDREALIEEARERIYAEPGTYVRHVYGEHEAGGTSWLYIGDVPFESFGLPDDVRQASYPDLTRSALSVVPMVVTLWPPLLMAMYAVTRRRQQADKEDLHG